MLLKNKGKPIDLAFDMDLSFDLVEETKDMFSHQIRKIMLSLVPFDRISWKKVSPVLQDVIKQHIKGNYLYLDIYYV